MTEVRAETVRPGYPARTAPLRTAALALSATGAVAVVDPTSTHVPLCPLHAATGLWCPLCGGLRAVFALTRLDVRAALHANALFVLVAPALVALWVDWVLRSRRGLGRRPLPRPVLLAVLVAAAVFTVARNTPWGAALRAGQ